MRLVRRLKRIEDKMRIPKRLPPVFVNTLDELNAGKYYSIIFCASEDISREAEIDYETLFYGGVSEWQKTERKRPSELRQRKAYDGGICGTGEGWTECKDSTPHYD